VLFVRPATKKELDEASENIALAIERALDPRGPDADAVWELVELDANFRFPAEITSEWVSESVLRLVLIKLGTLCTQWTLGDVEGVSITAPNFDWMAALVPDASFEAAMREALAISISVDVRFAPAGATKH
jgi:hypothetical protein